MAWGWGSRVGGVPVARRSPTLSARRCRRLGGGGPAHRHAPTATLRLQTRPSSNPRLWTRPVDTPHRFWPRPLPASRSVERPARCWGGGGLSPSVSPSRPCPRPCPSPIPTPAAPRPTPAQLPGVPVTGGAPPVPSGPPPQHRQPRAAPAVLPSRVCPQGPTPSRDTRGVGTPAAGTEPGADGDGGIPEDIPAGRWYRLPGGGGGCWGGRGAPLAVW